MKQVLSKSYENQMIVMEKYFHILSIINDLKFSNRDVQVLAWISLDEGFTRRDELIERIQTSDATLSNVTSRLTKKNFLVMQGVKKYFINPALRASFTDFNTAFLKITLTVDNAKK